MSRRFHEHQVVDPPESIAALIHDSAEMILLSNHLRPLRGRQEIMASLGEKDRESELYSGTVETFEWLDETTVLVSGQARYVTRLAGAPSLASGGWMSSREPALDRACVHERVGRQSMGSGLPDRKQGTSREGGSNPGRCGVGVAVEVPVAVQDVQIRCLCREAGVIN